MKENKEKETETGKNWEAKDFFFSVDSPNQENEGKPKPCYRGFVPFYSKLRENSSP